MFQARHYRLIAMILRAHAEAHAGNLFYNHTAIVRAFADAFEHDNPRFNRARFEQACTPERTAA